MRGTTDRAAIVSALVVDGRAPAARARFRQAPLGGETIASPELGVVAVRAPGATYDVRHASTAAPWTPPGSSS